ncbi:MAG TPA: isoprenylcysteine carboxylmethyltransferase family protein [Pirellulales bacterium]|nr:isoprenylcysteine carboxylmethyltransferase family protein [Pirellulales bacterium]
MTTDSPNRFIRFLVRRRVPISIAVYGILVAEDVLTGTIPHDVFDWKDTRSLLGVALLLGGLIVRSWAAGFLTKSTQLTMTGPYRMMRNPLYLGSFLMVVAFCILIGDRENIWISAVLLPLLYIPKVRSEERYLSSKFPEEWARYAATTPRFFPRLTVLPSMSGWRLSQWLKSREYNAVAATLAAIVALKVLHDLQS